MSDFAYAYFNDELEHLDVPELEQILEKIQGLLTKKKDTKHSASDNFFAVANKYHGNSNGQRWTREELHER